MSFDPKKLTPSDYVVGGSVLLALISLLMPWVDLGFFGSFLGITNWHAWLFIIICWGYPVFEIATGKPFNAAVAAVGGLISLIYAFVFIGKCTGSVEGHMASVVGIGVYIFLISSIALIVGAVLSANSKDPNVIKQKIIDDAQALIAKFSK